MRPRQANIREHAVVHLRKLAPAAACGAAAVEQGNDLGEALGGHAAGEEK